MPSFALAAGGGHHCELRVAVERLMSNEEADANGALVAALRSLGNEFKANRLASALLKSKNERLLCDALASRLWTMLAKAPQLRVVREWGRGVSALGRRRIDLAVLRGDRPVVLLEAKVARSFDFVVDTDRRYPSGQVRTDIGKLREVGTGADRCVLLLVTHNHEVPGDRHRHSIPYFDDMERHAPISRERVNGGFERFLEAVDKPPVMASGEISAGRAFDTEVSVFWWLLAV